MDGQLHRQKADAGGRFNMPPPNCIPMSQQRGGFMPNSPHVPQSPHNVPVQSPHHVVPSPHHNIHSPAAHQHGGYGGSNGGGGGGVFQFSDAHIGIARADKDASSLALSNNPHHSPMPHGTSGGAGNGSGQYNKAHTSSTPVQGGGGSGAGTGLGSSSQSHGGMPHYRHGSHPHGLHHSGSDAMLSAINYNANDNEMLHDSAFDMSGPSLEESLLSGAPNASGNNDSAFDLFDNSDNNYHMDNQLSPQAFVDNSANYPLGQNENSQNSSHGSASSSVSSVSDAKTPAKPGRPAGRGRGASISRERASCPICGKLFNNSSALAKHKLTHSDERKHICSICAKAFKRQDHLNGHMMTHRSKKPFECKFEGCEKSYCDARSLRRHLENHHAQQLTDPSCMSANTFFQFDQQVLHQTGIYRQSSVDSAKSPGYTNQFSPISPAPGQWTGPYNPLDEPKPIQCQLCPRRFKNMAALNGHMRLHGGYFKKEPGSSTTQDEHKPGTSTITTAALKVEPPSSHSTSAVTSSASSRDVTISSAPPIIIAPQRPRLGVHSNGGGSSNNTTGNQTYTSSTAMTSAPSVGGALSRNNSSSMLAPSSSQLLSHHIEMMSINQGASSSSYPQSSMASLALTNSISQQGLPAHMGPAGAEFSMPRAAQYDDMAHAQDMRTQYPVHMGMSQLARRRSNVPPPIDPMSLNMGHESALHSPGPASCGGSHPATPSHPMTPSHPHTPSHPITPAGHRNHPVVVSHPHTPIAHAQTPIAHPHTPGLPYTPSLAQTPGHPLTPHTPHTPSHPCTPGHTQAQQHFQFPPPGGEQFSEYPGQQSDYVTQQQQMQQLHMQQQQQQQEQLDIQQVLEHELEQIQQEQKIQAIKEELQSHERQQQNMDSMQPHMQTGLDGFHASNPSERSNQEEFMDTNISQKTFVVQHCKVDNKMNPDVHKLLSDQRMRKLQEAEVEELARQRKRRHEDEDHDAFSSQQYKRPATLVKPYGDAQGSVLSTEELLLREKRDLNGNTKTNRANCVNKVATHNPHGNGGMKLNPQQRPTTDPINERVNLNSKSSNECDKTRVGDNAVSDNREVPGSTFKNPSQPLVKGAKRKHRPEPLVIPPQVNQFGFASRLRSPRLWVPPPPPAPGGSTNITTQPPVTAAASSRLHTGSTPPPYTPPPMLSPQRSGSGLFWNVHPKYRSGVKGSFTPKSAPIVPRLTPYAKNESVEAVKTLEVPPAVIVSTSETAPIPEAEVVQEEEEVEIDVEETDPPPETDIQPHVNIGPTYQAVLPPFVEDRSEVMRMRASPVEEKLWDPSLMNQLTEEEIQCYQDFACCAAIPGNGTNKEYALHLLYLCHGDIKKAILRLMQNGSKVLAPEPIAEYKYQESDVWSAEEIEAYHQALIKFNKDFYNIALEIGSKTVKQCIEFYYIWKKVCPDEYKRLRIIRRKRKREHDDLYELRSNSRSSGGAAGGEDASSRSASPKSVPSRTASPSRVKEEAVKDKTYICQFSSCNMTFATRQALNGHSRVHSVRHAERQAEREQERQALRDAQGGAPSPRPMSLPRSRENTPSREHSPSPARPASNMSAMSGDAEDFPCKVCGKVFYKVKSRNAHMKSHRQPDADKKSPKPPS